MTEITHENPGNGRRSVPMRAAVPCTLIGVLLALLPAGAADAAAAPVTIQAIELTQGIQTSRNEIPLMAGKATFVRVHVRARGGRAVKNVTARLTVAGRNHTPKGVKKVTASPRGSDRRSLKNGFLFSLDRQALRPGKRKVTIRVRQGRKKAVTQTVTAHFGPSGSNIGLRLYGVRYGYSDVPLSLQEKAGLSGPTWPALPESTWSLHSRVAQEMLPVAHIRIDDLAPGEPSGSLSVPCGELRPDRPGADPSCSGAREVLDWASLTVDRLCPTGGCRLAVMRPESNDGHGSFFLETSARNGILMFKPEARKSEAGLVLTHEIGHSLGLPHTFEDPNYPWAYGGLGPYIGIRSTPRIALVPGTNRRGQPTAFDIMSYKGPPKWISPYNYCRAMAVTTSGRLPCPRRPTG